MSTDEEIRNWEASGSYFTTSKGDGLRVFVKQIGNPNAAVEKTLLMLHGFPESSFSYHLVVDGLLQFFDRIVLFDFPGYGLSDKPEHNYSYSLFDQADVALEVWNHFGVTGGHLLAHDMGDSVATELVAREVDSSLPSWFSDGFVSYTFTNGSMVLELADLRVMQKLLLGGFGKILSSLMSEWIFSKQVKSAHGKAPLSDSEIYRLWMLNSHNSGNKITHQTIKYLNDRRKYESVRWLPALAKTRVPIHICWGDKDHVARVEIAHHLKKNVCPDAKLTIMEGVGHFCQMGSPEKWTDSILPFFQNR